MNLKEMQEQAKKSNELKKEIEKIQEQIAMNTMQIEVTQEIIADEKKEIQEWETTIKNNNIALETLKNVLDILTDAESAEKVQRLINEEETYKESNIRIINKIHNTIENRTSKINRMQEENERLQG